MMCWNAPYIAGIALLPMAVAACASAQPETYETRYYVIHSDLDEDAIREAGLRLTKMAEMYAERTRSFTGQITTRLIGTFTVQKVRVQKVNVLASVKKACLNGSGVRPVAGAIHSGMKNR